MQLCAYMRQECIVVRTKADIHIQNCHRRQKHTSVDAARKNYIRQVREETRKKTTQTQEVKALRLDFIDYIISEMGILQLVKKTGPPSEEYEHIVDEEELFRKLKLSG